MNGERAVPGFEVVGGEHCETTALRHVLRHAGIGLSEDMLLGLGGGIGFIYWYSKGMTAPLVGGRAGGRDFNLIRNALDRMGGTGEVLTTTSATRAEGWLRDEIRKGRPVICYGDVAYLPYFGLGEDQHFGGHVFVVYGLDETRDRVNIADRAPYPFTVSTSDLRKSRGSTHQPFPPRNTTIRARPPKAVADLGPGIRDAVRGCIAGLRDSPISNYGLRGFLRWAQEVRKWPRRFGPSLVDCLSTLYMYIETGGTGGSAFRLMYSRFLREAADVLGIETLREAADAYAGCAKLWSRIAEAALPDRIPALARLRQAEEHSVPLDRADAAQMSEMARRASRQVAELRSAATLTEQEGQEIVDDLAGRIPALHRAESSAVGVLARAVG